MSDQTTKAGPVMAASVQEVQGVFPSDAALQDAMAQLRMAGFDHADISLPTAHPAGSEATPDQGAATPFAEDDTRQARTLGTSMAGTIGAMAAAGATIATGGVAGVAIAAAAAVGAGTALAANAAGTAAKHAQDETRATAAAAGELILAVRAPTPAQQEQATRIMREAGASAIHQVERGSSPAIGIDSAGWTG